MFQQRHLASCVHCLVLSEGDAEAEMKALKRILSILALMALIKAPGAEAHHPCSLQLYSRARSLALDTGHEIEIGSGERADSAEKLAT